MRFFVLCALILAVSYKQIEAVYSPDEIDLKNLIHKLDLTNGLVMPTLNVTKANGQCIKKLLANIYSYFTGNETLLTEGNKKIRNNSWFQSDLF